jgi:hypothetical protein
MKLKKKYKKFHLLFQTIQLKNSNMNLKQVILITLHLILFTIILSHLILMDFNISFMEQIGSTNKKIIGIILKCLPIPFFISIVTFKKIIFTKVNIMVTILYQTSNSTNPLEHCCFHILWIWRLLSRSSTIFCERNW